MLMLIRTPPLLLKDWISCMCFSPHGSQANNRSTQLVLSLVRAQIVGFSLLLPVHTISSCEKKNNEKDSQCEFCTRNVWIPRHFSGADHYSIVLFIKSRNAEWNAICVFYMFNQKGWVQFIIMLSLILILLL